MSDITTWLENLGLDKYTDVFVENEIDFRVLSQLTAEDIRELGLPLGPRRILLTEIANLKSSSDSKDKPLQDDPGLITESSLVVSQAERRQLTVMFVDLVGSTALSGQLDPEDLSVIMRRYQNTVSGEINRLEGFVAKFMGDGVLAYFGWPRAHEDEAERAVRAGLAIVDEVARLKTPDDEALAARIGIATGQVVVGDLIGEGSAQEETVVGETPNIAARLEALAGPGKIVISERTRKLCGEVFEFEALGAQLLKGVAETVAVYQVGQERSLESRFQAQRTGAVLPLIGRETELAQIMSLWQRAQTGEGQMVLLIGEAGIGKSRIMRSVSDALENQEHYRISYQCSPYHTDSALYPAIQQLERAAGFTADDNDDNKLDKLESLLGLALSEPRKGASIIAGLLDIDYESRYGRLELDPQQRRMQTLQTLLEQLTGLAQSKPVLFVLEDAHWIDPTSLELIELALDAIKPTRIMLLMTARPSLEHDFNDDPIVTRLVLNRLEQEASLAIIDRLSAGKTLPAELMDEIIRKTDGVPLFVEELTKTVLESGLLRDDGEHYVLEGSPENISIPSSLQDSLMARLDRLQPVREVAQIASCIGRNFSYSLLASIAEQPKQALQTALEQLVDVDLISQRDAPPDAVYTFKHALVQDAAYNSLLRSRRQKIHARIVQALQDQPPALLAAQPELIARHASEAGFAVLAARFWRLAGERAAERAAFAEATSYFSKGLIQADSIEDPSDQRAASIKLNLGLAGSLRILDRFDEAIQALARAESAAKESGNLNDLAEVCYLRGNIYFPLARIDDCLSQHELARNYAREAGNLQLEARAQGGLGDAYYMSGRIISAGKYYRGSIALSLENNDEGAAAAYGPMFAITRLYQNECLAALDEAKLSDERATRTGNQRAQMMAYSQIGNISIYVSRFGPARDALERALAYSRRLGVRRFESFYLAQLSECLEFEGHSDKASEILEQAYAISRETSLNFIGPWILGKIARMTDDYSTRQSALQEGEDLLKQGCIAHCYFEFYREAIETALITGDWDNAQRYATALETYTHRLEPLPLSDFFIARGRALAEHGRGSRDPVLLQALQRLRDEAVNIELMIAVPALEKVLK